MLDITQVAQEPDGSLQAQVTLNLKVSSAEPLPLLGPGEQEKQREAWQASWLATQDGCRLAA